MNTYFRSEHDTLKLTNLLQQESFFAYLHSREKTQAQVESFKNEYLLQSLPDSNASLLSIAIKNNNYDCVKFLLNQNYYSEEILYSSMRESVRYGFLHICKLFFEEKNIPVFTTKFSLKQQTPFQDLIEGNKKSDSAEIYWHSATASYFIERCKTVLDLLNFGDSEPEASKINVVGIEKINILTILINSKFEIHHKIQIGMRICDKVKEIANDKGLETFRYCLINLKPLFYHNVSVAQILKYANDIFVDFKLLQSSHTPLMTRSNAIFFPTALQYSGSTFLLFETRSSESTDVTPIFRQRITVG